MAKDKRYFDNDTLAPLPEHSTSSVFLDCPTLADWQTAGGLSNLVVEDGQPRFKNDEEKRAELMVTADQMTNANTSKLINEGFLYAGIVFPQDLEGQLNFSELQRLAVAGHIDYPYEVWNGQESTELADAAEVEVFYLSGIAHKSGLMNAGRATRIANRNLSLAALQSYVDTASNSGE